MDGYDRGVEAIIAAVQPYEIHGTPYFRIAYATAEAPDAITEARLAAESIYRDPQPGDRVRISLLLGIINSVEKITEPA